MRKSYNIAPRQLTAEAHAQVKALAACLELHADIQVKPIRHPTQTHLTIEATEDTLNRFRQRLLEQFIIEENAPLNL